MGEGSGVLLMLVKWGWGVLGGRLWDAGVCELGWGVLLGLWMWWFMI